MNKIYIIIVFVQIILLTAGCNKNDNPAQQNDNTFQYPQSKIWAHKANDTITAKTKAAKFDGLEVDVIYSDNANELYVGHNEEDTINNLTLKEWFESLDNPSHTCYWIDLKTLNTDNADAIGDKLVETLLSFDILNKTIIENYSWEGLNILKKKGLHVLLWVDSLIWSDLDSAAIIKATKEKIKNLSPDAISCEYHMFPLLTDSFPEQNIHFWQTPAELNDENAEITRQLCRNKSVKVVLVDYDEPIDY